MVDHSAVQEGWSYTTYIAPSLLHCSVIDHSDTIWPRLTRGLFSYGDGLSINHHACAMQVGNFKLIIRNYKPLGFLTMFSFTGNNGANSERTLAIQNSRRRSLLWRVSRSGTDYLDTTDKR
uniref:SFRICE_034231 n=1 Tax=Spodoptera frugiperda TaxID=7108 RepID=A0A2H1VUI4_SPOFR